jgi:hypothetical protein
MKFVIAFNLINKLISDVYLKILEQFLKILFSSPCAIVTENGHKTNF